MLEQWEGEAWPNDGQLCTIVLFCFVVFFVQNEARVNLIYGMEQQCDPIPLLC